MNWFTYAQIALEEAFPVEEEVPVEEPIEEPVLPLPIPENTFESDIDRLIQVSSFKGDPNDNGLASIPGRIVEIFNQTEGDVREKAIFVDVDETLLANQMSDNRILKNTGIDAKMSNKEETVVLLEQQGLETYIDAKGNIFVLRPGVREFLSEIQGLANYVFVLSSKAASTQSDILDISGLSGFFKAIYGRKNITSEEQYNAVLVDDLGMETNAIQGKMKAMGYADSYVPVDSGAFYPKAITFTSVGMIKGVVDENGKEMHGKAKKGDYEAAESIVYKCMTSNPDTFEVSDPEKKAKIEEIKQRFPDALLVSMTSGYGGNMIPEALATYLSKSTGLGIFDNVHKTNTTSHTSGDQIFRLLTEGQYSFREGTPDLSGLKFVIVDDVMTSGGSISSLKNHLEQAGGIVVGTVVLAASRKGKGFIPDKRIVNSLVNKFGGHDELSAFLSELGIAGGIPEKLTSAQVNLLLSKVSPKGRKELVARKKSAEAYLQIDSITGDLENPTNSPEQDAILLKRIYNLSGDLSSEEMDRIKGNGWEDWVYDIYGMESPYIKSWHDVGDILATTGKDNLPTTFFCEEFGGKPVVENELITLRKQPFQIKQTNVLSKYIVRSYEPTWVSQSDIQGFNALNIEIENFKNNKKSDMLMYPSVQGTTYLVKSINNVKRLPQEEIEKMSFNLRIFKESAKKEKIKKEDKAYNPTGIANKPKTPTKPGGGRPKSKSESDKDWAKKDKIRSDSKGK